MSAAPLMNSDEVKRLLELCTCAIKCRADSEAYAIAMAGIVSNLTPEKIRGLVHQAQKGARFDRIKSALDTSKFYTGDI